jgi:hypothetical protein
MGNNAQAINGANELIALCQQCFQLALKVQDHLNRASAQQWNATWQQCTTNAVNADGTPGATDKTPVNTNPLNRATYLGLRGNVSQSQLAGGESFMAALGAFLEGANWQAVMIQMLGGN